MKSTPVGRDSCALAFEWGISERLALELIRLDTWAETTLSGTWGPVRSGWPGLFIISGYREPSFQQRLNPTAPQSLHTRCPALAADLRIGNRPASMTPLEMWALLGGRWKLWGFRWGGDFDPIDPNHFDLGEF